MTDTSFAKGYREGMQDIADLLTEADSSTDALARIAEWVQNNGAELTGFIPALTQHDESAYNTPCKHGSTWYTCPVCA